MPRILSDFRLQMAANIAANTTAVASAGGTATY